MKVNPPAFPDKRAKVAADDLLGLPPIEPLADILTSDEAKRLFHRLANGNAPCDYAMSFAVEGSSPQFCKSKALPLEAAIERAVATISGAAHPRKRMAFAPYPANPDGETCWGALDFDAHDGNRDRARSLAYKAWQFLCKEKPQSCVIIEEDPGESYHVWLLAAGYYPCRQMFEYLTGVATAIGATVASGVCELFPHAAPVDGNLLKPLRAPGSWHPRYGRCSKIAAQNLQQFVSKLPPVPNSTAGCANKEKYLSVSSVAVEKEENKKQGIDKNSLPNTDNAVDKKYIHEWASRFEIRDQKRRNQTLQRFVEAAIFQLGENVAREIAEEQYRCKTVETEADLAEHLRDFDSMWESCYKHLFLPRLKKLESERYEMLSAGTDRDAYRIVHNFSVGTSGDFAIVQASLSKRQGLTPQGASKLVRRLIARRIIERTSEAVPHLRAARYRWLGATEESALPSEAPPLKVDLSGAPPLSRTKDEQFAAFGDQIVALLALHGALSPSELQRRIHGYSDQRELCDAMLERLHQKLVIDVTPSGDFRLGPEKQHFKALAAQQLLKRQGEFSGISNTEAQFENLAHHFGYDVDELKRQRDTLIALGELVADSSGKITAATIREWPLRLTSATAPTA